MKIAFSLNTSLIIAYFIMKKAILFGTVNLFFLCFAQRSDAQCYVRMEDASGFNTDAYQDTLQAAAAKLCAIFDTTGFAGQFKVYDFGFYLHQESTTGGYPEAFSQKIAEVQALSPYYLLFGKQTDKSGVYTKFWVDLVLPDTGRFACNDFTSPIFKNHVSDKFNVLIREIYNITNTSYYKYSNAEIELLDSLNFFLINMLECCVPENQNRGIFCGGCLLSPSQFEIILEEKLFVATNCNIISEVDSSEENPSKINLFVQIEGKLVDLDIEIENYSSLYLQNNLGKEVKVFLVKFPDHCMLIDELLEEAESYAKDFGLAIVVGVVDRFEMNDKLFIKYYDFTPPHIEPNGAGYIYFFNESGVFINQSFGNRYHGIYFTNIHFTSSVNFKNDGMNISDRIAQNSAFFLSDQNLSYLKSKQIEGENASYELGGVASIGSDGSFIFHECTTCHPTAITIPVNEMLDFEQYPKGRIFLALWHIHPNGYHSDVPSNLNREGDFFVFTNTPQWSGTNLYIGPNGDYSDFVYQLPGGLGLLASQNKITVYRHHGKYYLPSSNTINCNQVIYQQGNNHCYEVGGETDIPLLYRAIRYDLKPE